MAPEPSFSKNISWPSNPENRRGNWTDAPCFYVSVLDGKRTLIAAGPFQTHEEALGKVDAVRVLANKIDPRAPWYAYGTCKGPNGWREGSLNVELGL